MVFGRDGAGRLASLTASGAAVAMDYDPSGRLAGVLFPSNADTLYDYDSNGRLGSITHHDDLASVLASFTMGYDAVGNITSNDHIPSGGLRTFGYDDLQRLTSETVDMGTPAAYSYDDAGNRLSSPLSATHGYDPASNRLTSDDQFTYVYDDNGNLTDKTAVVGGAVTSYIWNSRNQLTGIDFPGTAQAAYRYDALGRRIEKDVDGQVTRFVYDGSDIVLETDSSDVAQRRYYHGDGIDQPLMLEEVGTGEKFFYHTDHLGSVRMVTDEMTGAIASEYDYDAYGRRTAITEAVEQPYAFTGREWDDESGLYYYRARYYDPMQGRFLSEDPIAFGGGDANLYRYVGNNPLRWVDPSGLSKYDKFFGLPKKFWNWLHRREKCKGDPDIEDPKEARKLYEEWKRLGRPGPDDKRNQRGSIDFEILELLLPLWLAPSELGSTPCEDPKNPPCGN